MAQNLPARHRNHQLSTKGQTTAISVAYRTNLGDAGGESVNDAEKKVVNSRPTAIQAGNGHIALHAPTTSNGQQVERHIPMDHRPIPHTPPSRRPRAVPAGRRNHDTSRPPVGLRQHNSGPRRTSHHPRHRGPLRDN